MSVTVTSQIWKHSRAGGSALLVLLALAEHVNDYNAREGEAWTAWPSQTTLAAKCNCSVATVKRSLATLRDLGEIEAVGTRARGVVVYELLKPSLAQIEPGHVELGSPGGSGEVAQSGADLAQSANDLAQVEPSPSSTLIDKPEVSSKEEKEEEAMSPSPSAQGDALSSKDEQNDNSFNDDFAAALDAVEENKQQQVEEDAQRLADLHLALDRTTNQEWRESFEEQIADLEAKASVPA